MELAPAYPAFADVVARRARAFDAQGVLRVCGEGESSGRGNPRNMVFGG
jgi:hypothetical protein